MGEFLSYLRNGVSLKRIHHQKLRNFDKISLKEFNQIELKKWKHCQILFGDFRKKHVLQTFKQKRFPFFFWGNSNLFKTYFLLGSLFPQNDRKNFFDTKLEAKFHQNLEHDTYQSDIHTSLALLGYCMKPLVPK